MEFRIHEVSLDYETYRLRTPIKFGGYVGYDNTQRVVSVTGVLRDGRRGKGIASMSNGIAWAWPGDSVPAEIKMAATDRLAERLAKSIPELVASDPLEMGVVIEKIALTEAKYIVKEFSLQEEMPHLCVLMTASAFDGAVHDAFGKALGKCVYDCYGSEFVNRDLGYYLNEQFKGEYLDRYTLRNPTSPIYLYHLVGGLDPLTMADVSELIGDGLPETLEEWITQDGLSHLKIKLKGTDLNWDVHRVRTIDEVAAHLHPDRDWQYSLDFNEMCPNIDYLFQFLDHIRTASGETYRRIQYIEQPTSRDLSAPETFDMHEVAVIKPIVIDEALLGYNSLLRAHELGYTGVALKACKGQTQSLLMGAAALKTGMFLCVQDLTCPGRAFAWTATLASRIPTITAVEGNARQYIPQANKKWEQCQPGLFKVKDGCVSAACVTGPGLGYIG